MLIATDGSSTADRAARKGFELAEALEAPVTIVFVGHPKTGELVTQDTIATYAGEVETEVLLREGDPAAQILAAADEVDAGLIVVGNKGMVGAKGFLLGRCPRRCASGRPVTCLIARTVDAGGLRAAARRGRHHRARGREARGLRRRRMASPT